MKAARIYGEKDVRVEDVEEPVVEAGMVKIKVGFAGICGSDLHAYHHGMGIPLDGPDVLTGKKVPITLGHEFAGTIEELGDGVSGFEIGDKVAIEPLLFNEDDPFVLEGKYNLSSQVGFVGLNDNGGFAEYAAVKASMLHKLPEEVSLEEGALVEPAAVSVQAVKESQLKIGQAVAVFGVGPIGLLTIIAAKAAGASQIIAIDVSKERLEKAIECGATHTVNSMDEKPVEKIYEIVPRGVDVAYEAAGVQPTFEAAVESLKKAGQLMVIAAFSKPVTVDMVQVLMKEISITASLAYRHVFPEVIASIAAGSLDVKKVITKKIKLDDVVEKGLELLLEDKSQAKILIDLAE